MPFWAGFSVLELILSAALGLVGLIAGWLYIEQRSRKSPIPDPPIVQAPTPTKEETCPSKISADFAAQTTFHFEGSPLWNEEKDGEKRSILELSSMLDADKGGALKEMKVAELLDLLKFGKIRPHQLESLLGDELKAVHVRRQYFSQLCGMDKSLENVPYLHYDFAYVSNTCCENVLGTIPIPLGYAGPLRVNGQRYFIPMATTEGCLVASTNRGCRAISAGAGVSSFVTDDGMTRAPVVRFISVKAACDMMKWTKQRDNFRFMQQKFQETSRFARLKSVDCKVVGRLVFLRFKATTGDAMGMNMVSKGTQAVLKMLSQVYFPGQMEVVSLSGNYCVDKKAAAVNWIQGRGKSVTCDAVVPASAVREVLKTTVDKLVRLNWDKNFVGSAVAGNLGGFNAHSANTVTAIFLATGQDAAQNISSSNCITILEKEEESGDLYISCTMPSLEVGTIGGGTVLPPQRAALEILGCAGSFAEDPGENAKKFATIVAATVLAGELSLLAALASDDLVKSHIRLNRSSMSLKSLAREEEKSDLRSASQSYSGGLDMFARRLVSGNQQLNPETCSKILP